MIIRSATPSDLPGILTLQSQNLLTNLSEAQRKDGFVTTPFTTNQLQALLPLDGLFIAETHGQIAAYVVAADWSYLQQWPIFPYMIQKLTGKQFHGTTLTPNNTFQYGPICIAHEHRGTNLFPRIFNHMKQAMQGRYPIGTTFINKKNGRSFKAHTTKVGQEVIDEFEFNQNQYYALAFLID